MSKKTEKQEKEKLNKELRKELQLVLEAIWIATADMTFSELASKADLSVATVTRLYYGVWIVPQARTIQKLGRVVGYTLSFSENGILVTVDEQQLSKLY